MSSGLLILPRAVRRAVLDHARRDRPLECCGFLLGAGPRVRFAVAMRNVASSCTRYRIDDAAHVALRRALRGFVPALSIVGVYHSHPAGSAEPSETDIREAMYPDWTYVIIGGGGRARVRAFRFGGGKVREVVIRQAERVQDSRQKTI